jgi:hypothetical protein
MEECMEFITRSSGKKRQMILSSQVNANTFLLFFEKGDIGYSWSIRDYSSPHSVTERYALEFGCSAAEVRERASYVFDAPTVPTTELAFWHEYTKRGNALFIKQPPGPGIHAGIVGEQKAPSSNQDQFPILNLEGFRKLPKAAKRQDLERMFLSPNSEDWVTWNLLNLLVSQNPKDWHLRFLSAAKNANPALGCDLAVTDAPRLAFWHKVPSPIAYQQANREKMRQSPNPAIVARSLDPRPVEGDSEIDVVISTGRHLIFIEAKLGSDISLHTTYDAARNQIVRNIDCVLETAAGREPFFWMLARDVGPGRVYSQLVKQYRDNPELVIRQLPHRDPRAVNKVCKSIAIIRWEDLREDTLNDSKNDAKEVRAVKNELRKRLSLAA